MQFTVFTFVKTSAIHSLALHMLHTVSAAHLFWSVFRLQTPQSIICLLAEIDGVLCPQRVMTAWVDGTMWMVVTRIFRFTKFWRFGQSILWIVQATFVWLYPCKCEEDGRAGAVVFGAGWRMWLYVTQLFCIRFRKKHTNWTICIIIEL